MTPKKIPLYRQAHNLFKPSEKQIQDTILDYLIPIRLRGDGYFNRTNTGNIPATYVNKSGETKHRIIKNGQPGQPDITGVYKGWSIYIEVKDYKGTQNPDQKKPKLT